MKPPVLFDDFRPGETMGEATLTIDESLAARWGRAFGEGDARGEGAGLVTVMMMRAYMSIITPRPPGNVHVRQRFTLLRPPARGEAITTRIDCVSKEMRKERRYLELRALGTDAAGGEVYHGTLTMIWAA